MTAAIVQLPNDLPRMREADVFVREWAEVEYMTDYKERVRQYAVLRDSLQEFTQRYYPDLLRIR